MRDEGQAFYPSLKVLLQGSQLQGSRGRRPLHSFVVMFQPFSELPGPVFFLMKEVYL